MNNNYHNLTDAQILRRKAEEKLRDEQDKFNRSIKETDARKLLHELQVHQIELEMQNEELLEANATAEASLKKYTLLYDFAPMGYFTLDEDGSIIELNFTAAELLGERRFSLINRNLKLYISEDSHPAFDKFFSKIYAGVSKEFCEATLAYDNKSLARVFMEGIVTGDDRKCLLSVVDISSFRR
jgi:PAS domain S-box-containing protein